MKKRLLCLLTCTFMFVSLLQFTSSAGFQVTYYNEEIYAGGILDMRAFVDESNLSGYTFQWQTDASLGDGHWYDLEDNASYKGTDTNHLQLYSAYGGDYKDWNVIPFRCVITKNGVTKYTPNLYMRIRPSDDIIKGLKNKGMGLYEPSLTNVTSFSSKDDLTYTANAYAGSNIGIICGGSSESQIGTLVNSEVQLKREIKITENGKHVVSGDKTSYIPYTVGNNAVKIEVNMRIVMAGVDRGIYQTKTINLTTKKPNITATGKTKSACSLLRYTYNESEKLASIPKGTNLEIVGKEGSYYQVYYNGFVGYVGATLIDATSGESKTIEHVELNMTKPAAGNVWPSSVTVKPDSCFLTSVEWYDKTAGHYLKSGERFVKGHDYQVVIWVTAKDGYRFKLDSKNNMLTTAVLNSNLPCFTSRAYEQENGKVIDIRYDFNNVQNAVSPTPGQTQNPTTQPQHKHTPSGWRINQVYHYKVCTTCGDMLEQKDHNGGSATCSQKGKCTVCGYAYIEENEKHNPDNSKWTACGDLYHARLCKDCGAHAITEDHKPGPSATETEPQKCTICGYIITPAKNHKHNLTRVEKKDATCIEPGNVEYYICDGCSDFFADGEGKNKITDTVIAPTGHKISDEWKYDENNHWRICSICKEVLAETQMGHEMNGEKCTTCNFDSTVQGTEFGTGPDALSGTDGLETDKSGQSNNNGKSKNLTWLWILLPVVATVGAGVVICLFVFKKKAKDKPIN